jgi:hypothetical protein
MGAAGRLRTYSRGRDYAQRGKVRGFILGDPRIAGEVSGSGGQIYHQSIGVQTRRGRIRFDGDCSCPMQSNCKHVVAVLFGCLDQMHSPAESRRFEPALSERVSAWLQQVQRVADDAGAAAVSRSTSAQRLVYVLIPDRDSGRVEVQLCKARIGTNGAIVSASVFNDIYRLLNYPTAFARPADLHTARLFVAMSAQCSLFVGRSEARGAAGADFIRMVRERACLGWVEQKRDLKAGPIHQIKGGPAREGGLAWRARSDEVGVLRLGWQFADGAPIDFVLPTEPPMYVQAGLLGELILPDGEQALPVHCRCWQRVRLAWA